MNCETDSLALESKLLTSLTFNKSIEFLNSIVNAGALNSFSKEELEILFGKHAELLKRHKVVRNYITKRGYNKLATTLDIRK